MSENSQLTGKLIGVGVGPGDPELMTLKAVRLIKASPVIAYPAAEGVPSFARQIAAEHLRPDQQEFAIEMPMKVERFPAQDVYEQSAKTLGKYLDAGLDVAVLCEGDPFFYGSFMYLFGRMADRYQTQIVPGVSSLTACASAASFPITARNDVLTVLPGPLSDDDLARHLEVGEAFVIPKVGRHLGRIKRMLAAKGLLDQAKYVERASLPNQVVAQLADVTEEKAPYFSMVLVHRRGNAYDGDQL